MNDSKHEDSDNERRKHLIDRANVIENLQKSYERLKPAADGELPTIFLTIARTIFLNRNPHILSVAEKDTKSDEGTRAYYDKTRSSDPLSREEKDLILSAVHNLDIQFLKYLIEAMELCEKAGGIDNYPKSKVVAFHDAYKREYQRLPTNRQLLESLNEGMAENLLMDRVTLSFFCKAMHLPLADSKRGRPKKRK